MIPDTATPSAALGCGHRGSNREVGGSNPHRNTNPNPNHKAILHLKPNPNEALRRDLKRRELQIPKMREGPQKKLYHASLANVRKTVQEEEVKVVALKRRHAVVEVSLGSSEMSLLSHAILACP